MKTYLQYFTSNTLIIFLFSLVAFLLISGCDDNSPPKENPMEENEEMEDPQIFYKGGDLSYVNEMLDCGAQYLNTLGNEADPYVIFSEAGCDIVRVRLWHNPDWTAYSDFEDVKKTIVKSKQLGMKILLDFHYSDDWADPGKQYVPAAWLDVVDNTPVLGDSLYNYTYKVLDDLNNAGLLPEFVQVGNEINSEILQVEGRTYNSINWARNGHLLNRGLQAVRDASDNFQSDIGLMLHIAQPENAVWWFDQASENGVNDFDWIGISYYPLWSDVTMSNLEARVRRLIIDHGKRLMVVETAYPYTLDNVDAANNILGEDAVVTGYPATEQGQYDFLKALEQIIYDAGGEGIIYWEPAWVSTGCSTRWGQGSHWDNATFFNSDGKPNLGMNFFGD